MLSLCVSIISHQSLLSRSAPSVCSVGLSVGQSFVPYSRPNIGGSSTALVRPLSQESPDNDFVLYANVAPFGGEVFRGASSNIRLGLTTVVRLEHSSLSDPRLADFLAFSLAIALPCAAFSLAHTMYVLIASNPNGLTLQLLDYGRGNSVNAATYSSVSGLGATISLTASPNAFVVSRVQTQTALNLVAQLLALASGALALCVNLLILYHKMGDRKRTPNANGDVEMPAPTSK
jgi:hypothetical protein